ANVAYAHQQSERADAAGGDDSNGTASNGTAANATAGPGTERSSEPTLDQQIAALESRSDAQVETYLSRILDPDASVPGDDPAEFLPTTYEPGTTRADARTTLVFQ